MKILLASCLTPDRLRLKHEPKTNNERHKMKLSLNIPNKMVERIVMGIMENFPEAGHGNALKCTGWHYNQWKFDFIDTETGKEYHLDKPNLIKAFPLIFSDKWPKGCTQPPHSNNLETWEDWLCQCDATDDDAFVQLACLGEVIYG